MRRSVGVGAIHGKKVVQEKFKDKGTELNENLLADLTSQLSKFRENLEEFATKHKKLIKKDPEFREHFQNMCATIGVDPLASSKGFWSEMLGMGSFYYEVAVQTVEVILARATINGGVMRLGEIKRLLNESGARKRNNTQVSSNDILRAIKSLNVLGRSCGIIPARKDKLDEFLIFCVPEELSLDNTAVVEYAAKKGTPVVTVAELAKELRWDEIRAKSVIDRLLLEGIIWVDIAGPKASPQYWLPSLFLSNYSVLKSVPEVI